MTSGHVSRGDISTQPFLQLHAAHLPDSLAFRVTRTAPEDFADQKLKILPADSRQRIRLTIPIKAIEQAARAISLVEIGHHAGEEHRRQAEGLGEALAKLALAGFEGWVPGRAIAASHRDVIQNKAASPPQFNATVTQKAFWKDGLLDLCRRYFCATSAPGQPPSKLNKCNMFS
jgi:hypothetical protein